MLNVFWPFWILAGIQQWYYIMGICLIQINQSKCKIMRHIKIFINNILSTLNDEFITMNIQLQRVPCVWRFILQTGTVECAELLVIPSPCGLRSPACIMIELTSECVLGLYDQSPNTWHMLECAMHVICTWCPKKTITNNCNEPHIQYACRTN